MEEDIKKIKEEIENFMEKYDMTVEVETSATFSDIYGNVIKPKVNVILRS